MKRTETVMILISGLTNCKMYLTWKSKSTAALQGKTFRLFIYFFKEIYESISSEQGQ